MRRLWEGVRAAFHRPETRRYRVVQTAVWVLDRAVGGAHRARDRRAAESPWRDLLSQLDRFVLWFFGAELVLRVLSYHPPKLDFFHLSAAGKLRAHVLGRLRYCLTPLMLVDIVTVAALVPALRGLRVLRLLRLLRTVKVFRYSNPFSASSAPSRENASAVQLRAVDPRHLGSARWHEHLPDRGAGQQRHQLDRRRHLVAVVTLTTVGFGDNHADHPARQGRRRDLDDRRMFNSLSSQASWAGPC